MSGFTDHALSFLPRRLRRLLPIGLPEILPRVLSASMQISDFGDFQLSSR